MSDKRAYFKLDVGYLTNPKVAVILSQSPTAVLLHIGSIAYSAQHLTDGVVPVGLLMRLSGATEGDDALLFDAGLWAEHGAGTAQIRDYLKHQRSSQDAKGASDKAAKAAHARWGAPEHAAEDAQRDACAKNDSMPREKERKRENTTDADASGFDLFWATYPKKQAKGAAEKAYRTAIKKVEPHVILAALSNQLDWFAAQIKPNGDFRPAAGPWLNAERWLDEVEPSKVSRRGAQPEGW